MEATRARRRRRRDARHRRGVALLSAVALSLGAWAPSAARAQQGSGGSALPCAVPLAWRVAEVDGAFALSPAVARDAMRAAAAMWEAAVEGLRVPEDDDDGFPVRFVFDERQARLFALREEEARLTRMAEEIEEARASIVRRDRDLALEREAYEESRRGYERRLQRHNDEVRAWNERGGAPADVAERLRAEAESLEGDRVALQRVGDVIRATSEELGAAAGLLDRWIHAHAEAGAELDRRFPPVDEQSGEYRERVEQRGDRIVSISREIRVYRFDGTEELRVVLAHELGHALGLGHRAEPGAVMRARHGVEGIDRVAPGEASELRALCAARSRGSPR